MSGARWLEREGKNQEEKRKENTPGHEEDSAATPVRSMRKIPGSPAIRTSLDASLNKTAGISAAPPGLCRLGAANPGFTPGATFGQALRANILHSGRLARPPADAVAFLLLCSPGLQTFAVLFLLLGPSRTIFRSQNYLNPDCHARARGTTRDENRCAGRGGRSGRHGRSGREPI
jgi:hypothetical protein